MSVVVSTASSVTFYSRRGSPACEQTRAALDAAGIDYAEVDLSTTAGAQSWLPPDLQHAMPPIVIAITSEQWTGHRPDLIDGLHPHRATEADALDLGQERRFPRFRPWIGLIVAILAMAVGASVGVDQFAYHQLWQALQSQRELLSDGSFVRTRCDACVSPAWAVSARFFVLLGGMATVALLAALLTARRVRAALADQA